MSEEARSSPAKTSMRHKLFFLGILGLERAARSWRARINETPHAGGQATARMPGVDGDSAENVRGRAIILHHKREIRIPPLRRYRKLDTRKVAQAASPPADFATRFSVPAFHTTGERWKANMALGRSLTARSDRISQTIRSSFFKSDLSAFWPKSEGTKALATTHHGENQVSGTL